MAKLDRMVVEGVEIMLVGAEGVSDDFLLIIMLVISHAH